VCRVPRQTLAWLGAWALVTLVLGCAQPEGEAPEVQFELTLTPSPPTTGNAQVTLQLADKDGAPIEGAQIHLEGNMNHAGMMPSFAELREVQPGRYQGTLDFTMGGDWFILVDATLADGARVEGKIDVPGVKAR
jgi:hypothetical protein